MTKASFIPKTNYVLVTVIFKVITPTNTITGNSNHGDGSDGDDVMMMMEVMHGNGFGVLAKTRFSSK